MNDDQLLRYSRQIMLPEMDIVGQQKLLAARVLIVGLGGLGCPVAMYLAAAGLGHIILADDDVVELTNLQRQIAHGTADIGQLKVDSAAQTLKSLNNTIEVSVLSQRMDPATLQKEVAKVSLVVDATDNFATRFAINRACVEARVPLVSGAAIGMQGQVIVFDPRQAESPCYQCLYKEKEGDEAAPTCAQNGVMAPLVGIIGAVQAMEVVKIIAGIGKSLVGQLLLFDASAMEWREMKLPRDANCEVCSGGLSLQR